MGTMWKPWHWAAQSNESAVGNARGAATRLSRLRVERQEIELFLQQHRTVPAAARRAARRPA